MPTKSETWTFTLKPDQISKETFEEVTGMDNNERAENYKEENAKLKIENESQKYEINRQRMQLEELNGIIKGLMFALRCDGISGKAVKYLNDVEDTE